MNFLNWKHWKLGRKLGFGFGLVLVLGIAASAWAVWGINTILGEAGEVIDGNALRGMLFQREIDHLNWANKVAVALNDDKTTGLDVQIDPHQCGFGAWYYSDQRTAAEARVPALGAELQAMEEPHNRLHASAAAINKALQSSDAAKGRQTARGIYLNETKPCLEKIRGTFAKVKETVDAGLSSDAVLHAEADRTLWVTAVLAAIALIVGIVLAATFTRSIVRPIRMCRDGAEALGRQDFTRQVEVDRGDEIGELAATMNRCAGVLEKSMEEAHKAADNLQNIPTPVMTVDRDFTITSMNLAGANLVGLTAEQCVGRKCHELFKTPHCHTAECRCAKAMNEDGIFTGETVADPSGLNLPIMYTGAPIKDRNGQIVGALEYVVDMSAMRKAMNEAQRHVENLNNLPTPVMAVDRDFTVTFMNRAGAGVLGLQSTQCVGRKCYELFKTPHCRTAECRCQQAMAGDGAFSGETIADPSGLNLPIMYTGAPIKNETGQIVGALEYVVDMTEVKRGQAVARKIAEYQDREVARISETLGKVAAGDLRVKYDVGAADDDTAHVFNAFTGIARR